MFSLGMLGADHFCERHLGEGHLGERHLDEGHWRGCSRSVHPSVSACRFGLIGCLRCMVHLMPFCFSSLTHSLVVYLPVTLSLCRPVICSGFHICRSL